MRSNPLVTEVLVGLTRRGKAQLDALGLVLLQAAVVFVWWPKDTLAQVLETNALTPLTSVAWPWRSSGSLTRAVPSIPATGQHGTARRALRLPWAGPHLRATAGTSYTPHLLTLSSAAFMAVTCPR